MVTQMYGKLVLALLTLVPIRGSTTCRGPYDLCLDYSLSYGSSNVMMANAHRHSAYK